MAKTPLSAVVVIDYQNVHLTAYDIFNRGGDRHDSRAIGANVVL